ncbi:hypothetical protein [Companilactobacillus sp. DQM5]|uniref:hypothetical protein n=1 Tax=Companilactobacillus sp. DQM5 TaxID=3463359 RepID=UPI0040597CD4
MFEKLNDLQKIYKETEKEVKKIYKKNKKQRKFNRWRCTGIINLILLIISLIVLFYYLVINSSLNSIYIFSILCLVIFTLSFIFIGYKLDDYKTYTEQKELKLKKYKNKLLLKYSIEELKELLALYDKNLDMGLRKFQMYTSLFTATIISLIIVCIPKLLDFFVHRMSESTKIATVILFIYLSLFFIILTFSLFRTAFLSDLDTEINRKNMYIDYVNMIIYEDTYQNKIIS